MKGEVAQVKEEKPKKPAAKSMMEMLRETAESLKKYLYFTGNGWCEGVLPPRVFLCFQV